MFMAASFHESASNVVPNVVGDDFVDHLLRQTPQFVAQLLDECVLRHRFSPVLEDVPDKASTPLTSSTKLRHSLRISARLLRPAAVSE